MSTSLIFSAPAEIAWAIMGILLVFCEVFIPGLVIAFFGIGALVTALTTWIGLTPTLAPQLLVFIFVSLLLLVLLRKYMKRIFFGDVNTSPGGYDFNIEVGKIVPVVELIQPGEVGGKVRYQGTIWSARAEEVIPPGESVRIVGRDNITLLVERVKK